MNAPSHTVPRSGIAPVTTPGTRPMYWSVRRELWENRSIYLAPAIVAVIFLFGHFLGSFHLAHQLRVSSLDPAQLSSLVLRPYGFAEDTLLLTAFLVGIFYCLDALNGERRDRSILFWKSLPVSDRVTVLSKATVPLFVLPAVVFAVTVAMHFAMLLLGSAGLLVSHVSPMEIWSRVHLLPIWLILLYTILVTAIWHAPLYCLLLLISAWTRRAPFLWVAVPLLVISVFEWISFRTLHFVGLLRHRLYGGIANAFREHEGVPTRLSSLDPGHFLATPGVWLGLAFAALCLFAAMRVRKMRDPI